MGVCSNGGEWSWLSCCGAKIYTKKNKIMCDVTESDPEKEGGTSFPTNTTV